MGFLLFWCLQGEDLSARIAELSADAIEDRDQSESRILSRWKEWTDGDLRMLETAGGHPDLEIAGRARRVLFLIRARRGVTPRALRKLRGFDHDLLAGRAADVLIDAAALWRKGELAEEDLTRLARTVVDVNASVDLFAFLERCEPSTHPYRPLFAHLLNHASPQVRLRAAREVVRCRPVPDRDLVLQLLSDPDPSVRGQAARAVAAAGRWDWARHLSPLLRRDESCADVLDCWGELGLSEFSDEISKCLRHWDSTIVAAAYTALFRLNRMDAKTLIELLQRRDVGDRALQEVVARRIPGAVEAIVPLLKEENRAPAAALALVELGSDEHLLRAVDVLAGLPEYLYDGDLIDALARRNDRALVEPLFRLLGDAPGRARVRAMRVLVQLTPAPDAERFVPLLRDSDRRVRSLAIEALQGRGKSADLEALLDDPEVAREAADALLEEDPSRARRLLEHPSAIVRMCSIDRLDLPTENALLIRALRDEEIADAAHGSLAQHIRPEDAELLLPLLAEDGWVRVHAVDLLGRSGSRAHAKHLLPFLESREDDLRWATIEALGRLASFSDRLIPLLENDAWAVIEAWTHMQARERLPEIRALLGEVAGADEALAMFGTDEDRRGLPNDAPDPESLFDVWSREKALNRIEAAERGSAASSVSELLSDRQSDPTRVLRTLARIAHVAEDRDVVIRRLRERPESAARAVLLLYEGSNRTVEVELLKTVHRGLDPEFMIEVLYLLHAPDLLRRVTTRKILSRDVASVDDLRSLLKLEGFELEAPATAPFSGRYAQGGAASLRDLVERIQHRYGWTFLIEPATIRLVPMDEALAWWKKRLGAHGRP